MDATQSCARRRAGGRGGRRYVRYRRIRYRRSRGTACARDRAGESRRVHRRSETLRRPRAGSGHERDRPRRAVRSWQHVRAGGREKREHGAREVAALARTGEAALPHALARLAARLGRPLQPRARIVARARGVGQRGRAGRQGAARRQVARQPGAGPAVRIVTLMRGLFAERQWLVTLALLLLIVSLLMPPVTLTRDTFSYIVTFDITQSMDTEDVGTSDAPTSRLEFARAAMRGVLAKMPCGSKVGWSIFTGQRTMLLLPPAEVCGNFDALLASLNGIDGRMRWSNWSRIAEGGIYSAVMVAQNVGRDSAVIFVTDGQEAPPVLPSNDRVRDIARGKVGGWLIGVGGEQPANIPRSDANGNRIGYWRAQDVIQVPTQPGVPTTSESHEELSELRG